MDNEYCYAQSPPTASTAVFFNITEISIYSTEVMLLLIALRLIVDARRKDRVENGTKRLSFSVSMASHTSVND